MTTALRFTMFLFAGLASASVLAENWPMFRYDRLRTAVSREKLTLPLKQVWMFQSRQSRLAPEDPQPNVRISPEHMRTMLHISAAGDAVFLARSTAE
jgi:hypothetical protein